MIAAHLPSALDPWSEAARISSDSWGGAVVKVGWGLDALLFHYLDTSDLVRVSGKSRDLLQEVIQLLRQSDFGLELQFTNYRTN